MIDKTSLSTNEMIELARQSGYNEASYVWEKKLKEFIQKLKDACDGNGFVHENKIDEIFGPALVHRYTRGKNPNSRNGFKKGHNNPNWKGNKVKYDALHQWINRFKPKPEKCERCNKRKPYDLANISGKYKRDVNDFEWLCRSCHMKEDGRILNLKQYKNE